MRRIALACVCLALPCSGQIIYHFDNLTGSNVHPYALLDGQDGWTEQTYKALNRCGVTSTLAFNGSKGLRFQESGPGFGTDASRLNNASWSFPPLPSVLRNVYFQADMQVGYWGGSFGLAYDRNANGIVRGTEAGERGVRFNIGTYSGTQFELIAADNTKVQVPLTNLGTVAGGHWLRIRVIMDLTGANAGGLGYVEVQNLTLAATTLTPVPGLQGVPLGLNPTAADATNPLLWNALWLHFEGATYSLDNIEIGRTGYARGYGKPCNGVAGPADLTLLGAIQPNAAVVLESGNHAASAAGIVILGSSDSKHAGLTLPLLFDPFLGTSGCSLYASVDVAISAVTSATAPAKLSLPLTIPALGFGARVFAQHACLEPVAGGMSFSNGLFLQLP